MNVHREKKKREREKKVCHHHCQGLALEYLLV